MGMDDGGVPARHHVRQPAPRSTERPRVSPAKHGQREPLHTLRPIGRLAGKIGARRDGQLSSGLLPGVCDAAKERMKARSAWHNEQHAPVDLAHAHIRLR